MLKKLVRRELKAKNYKCSDSDYEVIVSKAKMYTNGNVSEWIRWASMNHTPAKSELVDAN